MSTKPVALDPQLSEALVGRLFRLQQSSIAGQEPGRLACPCRGAGEPGGKRPDFQQWPEGRLQRRVVSVNRLDNF